MEDEPMRAGVGVSLLFSVCLWAFPAIGQEAGDVVEVEEEESLARRIVLYLPNRVFDVLDIVRARVRIGSGLAVSGRATHPASVFVGSYSSIYVGVPGPRGRPEVPWPFGVDSQTGIQISVADRTMDTDYTPRYSSTEVGAGFQLFLLGVDIGVDPYEVLDLLTGFFLIELREDDY
jgi:hypothetical protein